MKLMLDTNTCIHLIKRKNKKILHRLRKHTAGEVGISSVTLAELYYGVSKSLHIQKNKQALIEFIVPLEIAVFGEKEAESYGRVRSALELAGTPIGAMDLLIGAHALSLDATLVTSNVREFKRIHHLKVVDWTA